jgi:hypothetical protein
LAAELNALKFFKNNKNKIKKEKTKMANTINTRIVLRNDELSAWEESSKVLLKGEVALAKLSESNEFEMRVGTGDKTWNQLSDSNVIATVKDGSLTWSKMSSDVTDWKSVVEGNIEKLDDDLLELSGKVEGLSTELKGDIDTAKSEAISDAKAYTDSEVEALSNSISGTVDSQVSDLYGVIDVHVAVLNTHIDTQRDQAITDAGKYTDEQISALSIDLTSTYATKNELSEAESKAILSAKDYTDEKIAALDFTDTLSNLSGEIVKVADESAKAYTDEQIHSAELSIITLRDETQQNIWNGNQYAIDEAKIYTD